MIKFDNGGRLVQDPSELPRLHNSKYLYCDVETRSFDPKEKALKPYHGHRVAGVCITADDHPGAWYVPVRCAWEQWNLPVENVVPWLQDVVTSADEWVNHNVKFDAHFVRQDGVDFGDTKLVDTQTLAKIIDSDRFQFDLETLALDWLEEDISPYSERLRAYLAGCKSKDYGDVPADIIGEYGCQDAITTRDLHRYLLRRRPEECVDVWNTEVALTPVLFDMEVTGMRVDPLQLQKKELVIMHEMLKLEEELHGITGVSMRPHTNADCYEVLCNKYGLPVLGYTDKGEPSFDKDTLVSYRAHPVVRDSAELTDVVKKVQRYRHVNTLLTFFVRPYQEHQVDGVMHPDYNQTVRTGRMSCRRPNAQQLSSEAKELVLPPPDQDFVSFDYSQIEFRLIVHYIKALDAIAAYQKDPWVDFHRWVADMCGIPRRPAKNINFAIAFGGGRGKIVSMLASNMELVAHMSDKVQALIADGKITEEQRRTAFELLCQRRGEEVYTKYHRTLPTLRQTKNRASRNLELRGYVFNAYRRRRHLPERAAYRAFPTIIQSCAADVMKERTVALAPRYNRRVREMGVTLSASVHDETLTNCPPEVANDLGALRYMAGVLEDTKVKFSVPIKTSCGRSSMNWKIASGDEGEVKL